MSITMIGLDTAKSVFQIHAVDQAGKAESKRKLRRSELISFFEKQEACTVVMEACGAAHHWARMLTGLGHTVKLIAPEAVRPFVKQGKKNDAADAAAICEAASRPDVKFVPAKSLEQQGILALHSARSLLVKQQTMLANAMRGLAAEFGLTVPLGTDKLGELMALMEADEAVPKGARQAVRGLLDHRQALAESTKGFEAAIVAHARQDETARRLATIPGIGPITASLIRVPDCGHSRRHRRVPKRAALRGLAGPGAAAAFDRREDAPWSDHQDGQPGNTPVAGSGGHVHGPPSRAMEQRCRGLGQRPPRAPSCPAGDGGVGQQDGAHRLGGDDAQRGLPCEGTRRGRSCGVMLPRKMVGDGRKPG